MHLGRLLPQVEEWYEIVFADNSEIFFLSWPAQHWLLRILCQDRNQILFKFYTFYGVLLNVGAWETEHYTHLHSLQTIFVFWHLKINLWSRKLQLKSFVFIQQFCMFGWFMQKLIGFQSLNHIWLDRVTLSRFHSIHDDQEEDNASIQEITNDKLTVSVTSSSSTVSSTA